MRILTAVLLAHIPVCAMADQWGWVESNQQADGCWVGSEEEPSKPCLAWWDFRNDHSLPAANHCTGRCRFDRRNAIRCDAVPTHDYHNSGPDLHTEDPPIVEVGSTPDPTDIGKVLRRKALKCEEKGKCRCRYDRRTRQVFCERDPQEPRKYSGEVFITDAGGPDCQAPRPRQRGVRE